MTCRWKDEHGDNLYDTFIPEVERPAIAQDGNVPELQPGERRKWQPRAEATNQQGCSVQVLPGQSRCT